MPRRSFIFRALRFPGWKLRLLPEAVFWLAVARVALWVVPFPKIGRYLGKLLPPSPDASVLDDTAILQAQHIGKTVNTVADHLPAKLVCLPRALAGWQMLHRRGIASRLHFGAPLTRDPKNPSLQTHAWLTSAGVEVTGYPVAYDCVELGYFARESHRVQEGGPAAATSR